ncbi:NAD-dependent epimerase/dehydratase family protein [Pseudohoeflea coraliihabitans]|uniref:NAD(P)-dependent oxidoreductase n=1 Tax=Pseudohoeflea coraliihabitans TaxID=2860393 RepID=A0ABS6WKM8_9HYPH|nr:NAD(P)-dependent oxidoreductase [Pseudohoeflea sp. DP4N28-3]
MTGSISGASVAVTGGAGAIGSRLVARLAEQGATVTAIDRQSVPEAAHVPGVRHVTTDIGDRETLQSVLSGCDIVYHLAYLMGEEANHDPVAAARINTLGGTEMLQTCLEAKVGRVLSASSISVFGSRADYAPRELPLGDQAAQPGARGISVYGGGKVYLEILSRHYTRQHGMVIGGLRPGAVIGAPRFNGRAKALANIVSSAAGGDTVVVTNGRAAFQAIHIDDVVGALLALADADAALLREVPFYNLAGDFATMRSYCDLVAERLPQARFEISDGEIEELFGVVPEIVDDGIHRRIGYVRQHENLGQAIDAELAGLTARKAG